jgi:hypothetical protein
MVVHPCNPSTWEFGARRSVSLKPAWVHVSEAVFLKEGAAGKAGLQPEKVSSNPMWWPGRHLSRKQESKSGTGHLRNRSAIRSATHSEFINKQGPT